MNQKKIWNGEPGLILKHSQFYQSSLEEKQGEEKKTKKEMKKNI